MLRHQCVFQLVAIKQPEGNVICTRTEFQNMPCSCPCPEKQHPQPPHCSSSNNRGKQTLWPSGSRIIKVTFPKGKILLTFCIHVYIVEAVYINCVIMDLFSHKHVLNYLPPSNTDALGRCGRFPEHFCIFLRSGVSSPADSFVNNPSPLRGFF